MSRKSFYRNCYLKTGWLPMQPLTHSLAVGDVCQLRQGRFQPLLNLVNAHLIERIASSSPIVLDPVAWRLSHGVQQVGCTTQWVKDEDGEHRAFSRQVLEFEQGGSFIFSAGDVQAHLLTNWHQLRDDVTLKLTQLHYSFREAYVVTGVVKASDWALAVAGQPGARLEMSAALGGTDHFALFCHGSARSEQSHGIAALEHSQGHAAHFFKARKLVISDTMHDHYLNQMLARPEQLRPSDIANWLNVSLLERVKNNELNLNTSIDFFAWADMSLDDVELLSGS